MNEPTLFEIVPQKPAPVGRPSHRRRQRQRKALYQASLFSIQQLVFDFHAAFGVPARVSPVAEIPPKEAQLRLDLLAEELDELRVAIEVADIVAIADALGDLAYVLYGTAISFGVDLDSIVLEIHRSNMSKLGPDGQPVRRADGKVLKGPHYEEPRLHILLGLPEL